MTNGKNQPSMIPESSRGPIRGPIGDAITSKYAPGNIRYSKRILRMADLSVTAPGTEVSLGFTGEVMLFADFPVDIRVGQSPSTFTAITQLNLVGQIDMLWIRKRWAFAPGRVVIFMGDPVIGTAWRREDPQQMTRVKTSGTTPATWTAAATNCTTSTLAIPIATLGIPQEAYWLYAVHFVRTAGTIDYVDVLETETGGASQLAVIENDPPSDRCCYRFENPIRIASAHQYKLYGSAEAADTDVNWWLEVVLV